MDYRGVQKNKLIRRILKEYSDGKPHDFWLVVTKIDLSFATDQNAINNIETLRNELIRKNLLSNEDLPIGDEEKNARNILKIGDKPFNQSDSIGEKIMTYIETNNIVKIIAWLIVILASIATIVSIF